MSIRTTRRPSTSSSVSIASRVVPAISETITRSRPRKALTSEDLPTFGRPITASRTGASSSSSAACGSGSSSTTRSSRSPVPRPWVAETASGSPRPSAWNSAASGSSASRSTLLATTITGTPGALQHLRRSRRRRSAGRRGSRRRAATRSASAIASRAWARTASASAPGASMSTPPVSTSSKVRPFHSHSSALRSRVTPASLWVTASRPPASRLASVDLPTLGKPTIATCGRPALTPAPARGRSPPPARRRRRGRARWCRSQPRRRRPSALRARASGRARRARSARLSTWTGRSPVSAARRRARSSSEAVR